MSFKDYEPVDLARANFKIHQLQTLEKDNIENSFAGLVTEVLGQINDGKEATVYLCLGNQGEFLAAKIFKARHFRHFNTDKNYRDVGKGRDRRMARAMKNRSTKGESKFHQQWIDSEWRMLKLLHEAGVKVPRPIARSNDGVLMEYIGDEHGAAPRLINAEMDAAAWRLCANNLHQQIKQMLEIGIVHGDLSAYNILYHQDLPVIIDVPQAMELHLLEQALPIMIRDLTHLETFFAKRDIEVDFRSLLSLNH